jgi:2-polyprenyl-6-methoxyphenol hydroxylase-like FAD-dependent oxidoreductase
MQNSHPQYEVVVIGAGIAGTVLTHLLLQDNINTLLIGKADNPAIKLAESLPPSARPMLERLGLSDFFLAHQPRSLSENEIRLRKIWIWLFYALFPVK